MSRARPLVALLVAAATAALALPGGAGGQAPVPTLELRPAAGVAYPGEQAIDGVIEERGRPAAGLEVTVEIRPFPFTGEYSVAGTLVSDAAGRISLNRHFARNHQVRLRVTGTEVTTAPETAYAFPGFRLSYRRLARNVLRLTQDYTVPREVRLTQPTLFYLGRRGAATAPYRARAATRRISAGRYRSQATVRVPQSYRGRFSYASCFRYSPGSGMGNPAAGCSSTAYRFVGDAD